MAEKKFIPMINCGYDSGTTPTYWQNCGHIFDTEDECDDWIEENMENFSSSELGGCIYPQEIGEKDIEFYKNLYGM